MKLLTKSMYGVKLGVSKFAFDLFYLKLNQMFEEDTCLKSPLSEVCILKCNHSFKQFPNAALLPH